MGHFVGSLTIASSIPGASPLTVSLVFPPLGTFPAVTLDLVITEGSDLVTGGTFPASSVSARGFRLARPSRIPGGNPALSMVFPPDVPGDCTTPNDAVFFAGRAQGNNGTFFGNLRLPAPAARSLMQGAFLQDEAYDRLVGQGLNKVPIAGAVPGSFETIGVELEN